MSGRPVALVTGGTRRVGRAIALELARRGCDVVVTTREAGERAIERDIAALGVVGRLLTFDPSEPAGVAGFIKSLGRELPRLDVLVHNASSYGQSAVASLDEAALLGHLRVNAVTPALLTAGLSGLLGASPLDGGGSVVAMVDIHAMGIPRRNHVAYAMSKAALTEMVRSLARDLAPRVRVNGVAPGVVAWPEEGVEAEASYQERYLSRVPLGRAGTAEDAAGAVAWLALEARYVTGHIVRVDGGRSLV